MKKLIYSKKYFKTMSEKKKKISIDQIIFYFDNACRRVHGKDDETFVEKVRNYLDELKPKKIWEKRGILNEKLGVNVYPDFVMILNKKLIACEAERFYPSEKIPFYRDLQLFDGLWFFTQIPLEKTHLHYKFTSDLKLKQKFFGINGKGEIVCVKELKPKTSCPHKSERP